MSVNCERNIGRPELPAATRLSSLSYYDVEAVFAGFSFDPESQERGGCPIKKQPLFSAENKLGRTDTYASTYHSESTFPPKQAEILDLVAARMGSLVDGRLRGEPEPTLPTFSELIQHVVVNEGKGAISEAVKQAQKLWLRLFQKHYPTFMPALIPMMHTAGAAGLQVVTLNTRDFCSLAMISETSLQKVAEQRSAINRFHLPHPSLQRTDPNDRLIAQVPSNKTYEVNCIGHVIARKMIHHTADATLKLLDISHFTDERHRDNESLLPFVYQLAEETAGQYRSTQEAIL